MNKEKEKWNWQHSIFRKKVAEFMNSLGTEIFIVFCIVLSVSLLLINSALTFSPGTSLLLERVQLALNLMFILEYATRFSISSSKWKFVKYNLVDLAGLIPILRFFRLTRILRLIEIIRTARVIKSDDITPEFEDESYEPILVGIVLLSIILMGTVGMLQFEKGVNEHFEDFEDGIWWSVVTLTTVGYGDKFPITVAGRILAIVIMLLGLSFFALITGYVSSFIIRRYKREEFMGHDVKGLKDHIIICGWNSNANVVIKELLSLYHGELIHFVIVAENKPDFPLSDKIHFVMGDFTRKEILERAQLQYASSVIILADTTGDRQEQDIDARTVLASLAVERNNPEVYTCVEVISPENVDHVENTSADEIIISSSFTGNLLAHSVKNPGILKVYQELLRATEGNRIYNIRVSSETINKSFKQCASEMIEKNLGILIGLERNNDYMINPEELKIQDGDILVVISRNKLKHY